jgi:hypothetical protein
MMERIDLVRQPSIDSLSADDVQSMESEDDIGLSNEITKKETKDVLRHKTMVLFMLLASASIIATAVFVYITRGETTHFETKFNNDAEKLIDGVGGSLHRTLGLLDVLAVAYVSHARHQNDTWPFVTLPDYGARMAKLLPLTDAIFVTILPIIHPKQRKQWEEYSLKNDAWANETISLQETWSGYYGPTDYGWQPRGVIFGDSGDIEANIRYDKTKVKSIVR